MAWKLCRSSASLLSLLLLSLPTVACGDTNLDTDDGVRTAYKRATGFALDPQDPCIRRTGVRGVVILGSFADDRGCMMHGGFVGGEWLDGERLAVEGLPKLGWKEMEPAEQTKLARPWAEEVLYYWDGSFLETEVKAFSFSDTPTFAAPTTKAEKGHLIVTAWTRLPSGMLDQSAFSQIEFLFAKNGAVTRTRRSSFAVEGARLRQ